MTGMRRHTAMMLPARSIGDWAELPDEFISPIND